MADKKDAIKFEERLQDELVSKSNRYYNLAQEIIITTEDKLRIALMDYAKALKIKTGWVSPVTFFITLLAVLTTATFRDWIFPSATWQAIFVLLTIGAGGWIIASLRQLRSSKFEMNDLIQQLKKESKKLSSEEQGT